MKRRVSNPEDTQGRTLEMASLLGKQFPLPLLKAAAGSSQGLDAQFERGRFVEGASPTEGRFARASDAKKIAGGIPWSRRCGHFLALGEAAIRLRLPPHEIAAFFQNARQEALARGWWVKAAQKACRTGDYSTALTFLDRALSIWPWNEADDERVDILRELARCAVNGGKPESAQRAWEELADFASDADRPSLEVEALRQLAALGNDAARISEYLRRAAQVAERALKPAEAVQAILLVVDNLACRVQVAAAASELTRAVRIAERVRDPALLSEVRGWQGLLAAMSGRHAAAGKLVEESLSIAVDNELAEQAALAYRRRANIQDYRGAYTEERKTQTGAIEFCRRSKVGDELVCLGCLSYACFRTGAWQEALRSARAVSRDAHAAPTLKAIAWCVLGLVHAFRGERGPAQRHLKSALERFQMEGFAGMQFFGLWGRAYLRLTDDDRAGSIEVFDQIRAIWRETDDLHDVIPALLFAGAVYADADDPGRLADCLDILSRILRKNPLVEARAALAALRAEQARLDNRPADAETALTDAAAQYAGLNLPVERLWVECRQALFKQTGTPDPSHADAVALAKRLGTRPFLAILQSAHKPIPGSGELTARQAEVLQFLSSGLTSKEIADRLGLSVRTVEMHVSRLLQRLNCRTRPEAVRAAMRRGWLVPH